MIHLSNQAYVAAKEIEAIFPIDAAPIRRMITQKKEAGQWVDLSYGAKSKSVVLLKTGKVLESCISSKILSNRMKEAVKEV